MTAVLSKRNVIFHFFVPLNGLIRRISAAWFAPVQEQIDRLEGKVNGLMSNFNELLIDDRKVPP